MVSEYVQGPVNLLGEGFVARQYGNYQPGQFKRLSNMEIKNDVLTSRRNVQSVNPNNYSNYEYNKFLGSMGLYTLYNNALMLNDFCSTQVAVGPDGSSYEMWGQQMNDVPDMPPSEEGAFIMFKGFFRYNYKNYWITQEYWPSTGYDIVLYSSDIPADDNISYYINGANHELDLTRTVILSFPVSSSDFANLEFRNFFLYKERLWIATSVGLYYSKATDPTVFLDSEGNGGFFKYPNDVVTWAMAVKDNVYVLCTSSVYAITYNLAPNEDAVQRPISEVVGGEMGCVHLDTPYFINNLGIFSVHGTNLEKVMDSRFDVGEDYYRNHIYSFENYLVVNRYEHMVYSGEEDTASTYKNFWPNPRSNLFQGRQISLPYEDWDRFWGWTGDTPQGSYSAITTSSLVYSSTGTPKDAEGRAMYGMHSTNLGIVKIKNNNNNTPFIRVSRTFPVSVIEGASNINLSFDAYRVSAKVLDRIQVRVLADNSLVSSRTVTMSDAPVGVARSVSIDASIPGGTTNIKFEFIAHHGSVPLGTIFSDFGVAMNNFMLQDADNPDGLSEFFAGDTEDEQYVDYEWSGTNYYSTSTKTVTPYTMPISEGPTFTPYKAGNSLGYNTFFINTDNGSIHVFDFHDRDDAPVVDMYVNYNKDSSGNYNMYFMTNKFEDQFYIGEPYVMSSSEDIHVVDKVKTSDGNTIYRTPKIDVEIDSFVPDGNEHRIKKYRNLLIQGIFPTEGLNLQVAFNNKPYSDLMPLEGRDPSPSHRPHYPHRVGLNQRGRSLSIRFSNTPVETSEKGKGVFELSDIRTLWSYSGRAATRRETS